MEVSGQLHARLLYPQGRIPHYPFDRRLGGPQSRFGCRGEKKFPAPAENRILEPPIVQPVAQRYTDFWQKWTLKSTDLNRGLYVPAVRNSNAWVLCDKKYDPHL